MNYYIGIDPGKKGCLCLLSQDKQIEFFDWPKDGNVIDYYRRINKAICELPVELCVLEKVHAMPKQGVSSMFTFGTNFGMWQGWIIGWQIPCVQVAPQTWMKGLISKADGTNTKHQVSNAAQRMFPNAQLTGPMGGYKDGRGDALLMAYYAMLQSPGGRPVPSKKYKSLRRS